MRNTFRHPAIVLITLLVLAGCGEQDQTLEIHPHPTHDGRYICQFRVMSTTGTIMVAAEDRNAARELIQSAVARIQTVDRLMSSYRDDSDVSRLNDKGHAHKVAVSAKTIDVLRQAKDICAVTNGAFDVTYAPLKSLWQDAMDTKKLPSPAAIEEALTRVSSQQLLISDGTVHFGKKGMKLDLGGIAKGYAIDEAIRALRAGGTKHALVDLGGDMRVLGRREDGEQWHIQIRDPRPAEHEPMMLRLADSAVATSGDYIRYFRIGEKKYSHIIDPRTGRPAKKTVSATVIAPSAIMADGLATALNIMDTRSALELVNARPGVECLLMERNSKTSSNSVKMQHSDDFYSLVKQ